MFSPSCSLTKSHVAKLALIRSQFEMDRVEMSLKLPTFHKLGITALTFEVCNSKMNSLDVAFQVLSCCVSFTAMATAM